jgi:hypothetical protein
MTRPGSYHARLQLLKSLRRLLLSVIFLFSCLGFAQPQLDDYAPGVKVRALGDDIVNPDRQPRRDPTAKEQAMLPSAGRMFAAVFVRCTVVSQRSQRPWPWPFAPRGMTRAPPPAFSL